MQPEKTQVDVVSRYHAKLLSLENLQTYAVPLVGYFTIVEVFEQCQDFLGFKKVVSQVNPQLLATFEATNYE